MKKRKFSKTRYSEKKLEKRRVVELEPKQFCFSGTITRSENMRWSLGPKAMEILWKFIKLTASEWLTKKIATSKSCTFHYWKASTKTTEITMLQWKHVGNFQVVIYAASSRGFSLCQYL